MKNLFKNLMLVAVAAMAFTACSEDNNEVNNVERVTRYEFTAEIADDTRSGFVEKEDGATAYKSEWYGNETLKIFVTDYNGYYVETTAKIDDEGKFTLELEDAPANLFMKVCSPAESWTGENSVNIPAVQNPTALSVDPMAHILATTGFVTVQNGVADKIMMAHNDAAYGKMTVEADDFAIDHVVVDLKGSFYGDSRELSYTINAANVEGNTFWFATEPIDVTEFTVTAYDAEGSAIAKTVDMTNVEKPLAFNYGRVSTFSVSGLEAAAVPDTVMDSAKYYYDYNNYGGYSEWGYIVFEDEFLGTLVLNCKFPNNDLVLKIGTYAAGNYTQGFDVGYSYYNVVGDSPYELYYPSYMYVEVENGAYKLNFDIINTNGQTLKATYVGDIEGLGYPDLRTPLATPTNVTATAEANIITIKWDAVEGADGYRVKLFSPYEESFEEIVTGTEYVYEAEKYITQYSFTIMSYAKDENVTYKSSDDAYAYVTTGKDPNVFADFVYDTLSWNSQYSRFELTGNGNDMTQFYLNSNDSPGNNSINIGTYTYAGNTVSNPGEGTFSLRYLLGSGAGSQHYINDASMSVAFENDQYVILITVISAGNSNVVGKTFGYKGKPEGWVAPSEGGDQPDPEPDPEPDPDPSDEIWNVATDGTINSRYTYFRFTKGSDIITGMFVYPSKVQIPGLYEVEALTSYNDYKISEVKLNGIFTDSEEGTVNIEMTPDGGYKFTLNLTLNGTKYAGTAMM